MTRKYSVGVRHLIKKASPALLNFTKSTARFWTRVFIGYMIVSEMLETVRENDLFDMFPEFSNVVHILAVIPATSCSALMRTIVQCVAQIENLPPQHQGATTCQ